MKEAISSIEEDMKVEAKTGEMLLFYQFNCPHCGNLNVSAKNYKKEITLCSHTGCRKIIIIANYQDIA